MLLIISVVAAAGWVVALLAGNLDACGMMGTVVLWALVPATIAGVALSSGTLKLGLLLVLAVGIPGTVVHATVSPRRGALLDIRAASRTASRSDPRPGPSPR